MEREDKRLLLAFGIASAVSAFMKLTVVRGRSMEGALHDGDFLILSSRAYMRKTPCRGDIVVVNSSLEDENGKRKKLIKRVIGLPGEKVDILKGEVFIDGIRLDEEYVSGAVSKSMDGEYYVPEGSIFLMGDNRNHSMDSRHESVGAVKEKDICGKAVARIWPFNDRRLFKNEERKKTCSKQ